MFSIWLLVSTLMVSSNAYKVLVVFPMPSKSHSILGDGVIKALSSHDHEVTYLTPFPRRKVAPNIREIDISSNKDVFPDHISNIKSMMDSGSPMADISELMNNFANINKNTLVTEDVKAILNDPNEQFDVVIIEWMFHDLLSGLSAVFNCPFIWVSSTDPHWRILGLVDDYPSPSYVPDAISFNVPPFNFRERLTELMFQLAGIALGRFVVDPIHYENYEKYLVPIIKNRGNNVPTFDEVRYNSSLVLSNSHVSYGKAARLPQNFIPIGGYHIDRDVKPLPENLQKIFDYSKHGVIYFSLGSNLKSKNLPEELKQSLLKMFSTLKYSVIWKFEEDLPNKPSNVHIVQWAPQHSILAQPNLILFITHGGFLSITEIIHFGKPTIVIPIFADQFVNAKSAVKKGYGLEVKLSYTMADDIRNAIEEIATNPKYRNRAKELSMIYHDRPVTPDVELVHWVQHVVKTRGAPHLRSPALDVAWYQKMYLDLAVVTLIIIILIVKAFKRLVLYCKTKFISDQKKKQKKQ